MDYRSIEVPATKSVALVAHDHKKPALIQWCQTHLKALQPHTFYATGTTGKVIVEATGLPIRKLISGPMGGDQQIGALITEGKIDVLIFFWDPLEAQPHDPDVRALLRLAAVWNIPVACNESSADMIITSPLFQQASSRLCPDYDDYMAERQHIGDQ